MTVQPQTSSKPQVCSDCDGTGLIVRPWLERWLWGPLRGPLRKCSACEGTGVALPGSLSSPLS
jgi:DnaJ-class molecular chaperone